MILILDLDFTLNRIHPPHVSSLRELAPAEVADERGPEFWAWMTTHLTQVEYPARADAVAVLGALARNASHVAVITGRPETLRMVTDKWLRRYFRFNALLMRPDNDCRPNQELKREHLLRSIASVRANGEPVCAFEDDPESIAMYEDLGVTTFAAPACWPLLLARIGSANSAEALWQFMQRELAARISRPSVRQPSGRAARPVQMRSR